MNLEPLFERINIDLKLYGKNYLADAANIISKHKEEKEQNSSLYKTEETNEENSQKLNVDGQNKQKNDSSKDDIICHVKSQIKEAFINSTAHGICTLKKKIHKILMMFFF
jgi:hypothetical protein